MSICEDNMHLGLPDINKSLHKDREVIVSGNLNYKIEKSNRVSAM